MNTKKTAADETVLNGVKEPQEESVKKKRTVRTKSASTTKTSAKTAAKTTAKSTGSGTGRTAAAGKATANETKRRAKKDVPLKLLYAVSEVTPFITTGGMGQVVGALPEAISKEMRDLDVRVVAPLYEAVRTRFAQSLEFIGNTEAMLSWRKQYCGVFKAVRNGITHYFVDNLQYFQREGCYGYYDDGERFAFFSKAVFSVMEMEGFIPDIIHAHDWQTALVPVYLKTRFANKYSHIRSVFTIHNVEYQGKFSRNILGDIFDLRPEEMGLVEYDGCINLMKGAIICCDKLTTVSPSYTEELKNGGGFGLEPIINENASKFVGIINGIDMEEYNPATDVSLEKNYSIDTLNDKAVNKLKLQSLFGINKAPRKLLLCVISRLVTHKGVDLLTYIMEDLLKLDVQFLLLGTGDHKYELFFSEMALRYPERMGVNIAYNPEFASKIYAGADVMLMPSLSEPCGLAQMIACRYGTVPIVRATGGLKDTIRDCRGGDGNGFVFTDYNASVLLDTISQALDLYTYREQDWKNLMAASMKSDFSWASSAKKYAELYDSLRELKKK